ncbi:hypothetical protein QLX67_13320 [Balneolaceae bacterium ANBcel3]|nr:hypothetical protein [Balneolaceae bacterium ANBcel3]
MLRKTILLLLTTFIALSLVSCSDDDSPTGPDMSEAPDPPSVEDIEMDLSIFEEADTFGMFSMLSEKDKPLRELLPSVQNEWPPYEQAAYFASFAQYYMQIMGALPSAFFQEEMWGEPEVSGDTWLWEWGYSIEGESFMMRITATTTQDERQWELRYDLQSEDAVLDDALLIAAQVRLDGSGGSWQLYDFEEETPVFNVDYELQGDLTTFVDMRIDEDEDGRLIYESDGTISSLVMHELVYSGETVLEWNNNTRTGWVQSAGYRDGSTVCWDENFMETDC